MKYHIIGNFAKEISVSIQTLRNWHKNGKLIPAHITPAGTRYYSDEQLDEYLSGNFYNERPKHNDVILGCCNGYDEECLKRQIKRIKKHISPSDDNLILLLEPYYCNGEGIVCSIDILVSEYQPKEIILFRSDDDERNQKTSDFIRCVNLRKADVKVTVLNEECILQ